MSSSIIPFPPSGAEEHARAESTEEHAAAETKRKTRLFAWADGVLRDLGLADRITHANSLNELRKITFDPDAAEVELAIRDALHPVSGAKANYLEGLREGGLKRLLKMRFDEMWKKRETELLHDRAPGGKRSTYDWTNDLKLDDKGGIKPLLTNYILILTHNPKWKGVFAFDEFAVRVVIRKRPPWGAEAPDTHLTDHHESQVCIWFQGEDINAKLGDLGRAIQAAARNNPFHPVRRYLDALQWDGTPRLDTWLITHCHADDTVYVRAVGRRFPISAVARIYQPGCKVDHMPILEGSQGKQKSEAIRTLAVKDAWFTDRLSHVSSKDAAIEMGGVWLVEVAEMDALTRASSSAQKGFISRRIDRFRPPYGKHTIPLQRQCVFAGTINPPVGGYLKDPTGARRFCPVACHGMIDLDGIERDRNQLWAEAVHRYKAGEAWWMETRELEALAKAAQDARFKTDPWQETVERWLGESKDTSVNDVLHGALKISKHDQTRSAQMRVADILTHLGFEKYRARDGKERQNRYWKS
jgi:predicted P-loop ATPase